MNFFITSRSVEYVNLENASRVSCDAISPCFPISCMLPNAYARNTCKFGEYWPYSR